MPDRHGPYRSNRFVVDIEDIGVIDFSRVHLPAAGAAAVDYRTGNDRNWNTRKLRGATEYETLVLERGVTESTELYDWFEQTENGDVDEARKNITVILNDEENQAVVHWVFVEAWPLRYEPPLLDANTNEVAIETFEIAHEGMRRQ